MKSVKWIALVISASLITGSSVAQEAKVPELLASLQPAKGYVPLALEKEPPIYRFQVFAVEVEEPHAMQISAGTLIRPGQTRRFSQRLGEVELEGSVTLAQGGEVTYRASLTRRGVRVASSSAYLAASRGE
jgi:hypothetical protein